MTGRPRRSRPTRPRAALLIAMALALLAGACGGDTGTAVPGERTAVSLGIFSGRPDPSWMLTDAQSAELSLRLGRLAPAFGVPQEGGLGYRGFSISTSAAGKPDRILVAYRGAVAAPGPGSRSYLQDAARSVERYLLDTGRSQLAPEVIRAVEADLAGA